MVECEECGKTLGIFKAYQHPTMGKKHCLCSSCFDQVNESVNRWRDFVLENSFNNNTTSENNIEMNLKNIIHPFSQRRNLIDNVCAELGIFIKK